MKKPPGDQQALVAAIAAALVYQAHEEHRKRLLDRRDAAFAYAIGHGWAVRTVAAAATEAGVPISPSLVMQAVRRIEAEKIEQLTASNGSN